MANPDLHANREVKQEKHGYRCEWISKWHRERLGFHEPTIDLDMICLEFSRGKPAALIEYKHHRSKMTEAEIAKSKAMQAICILANNSHIPFFVVKYKPDGPLFKICGVNYAAKKWFEKPTLLDEEKFISFHRALRGTGS